MKEKVLENIKKYNLIENGDNIIIGLSGGPDSMALFYVLLDIEEIDFNIHIAHVNHGVRGEEAIEDEKFVENLAKKFKLPYHSTRVNMNQYAKEKGLSSEEAGRELRYGFFRKIINELGGGKIAVAHNKNDQAETLLMRFFRGTGIEGLCGMDFISRDIIRPILNIERAEIEKYLQDKNIETRLDKTNLETIYNRNKIRLELIPYIEENFNPNIVDALWRTSRIASVDNEFLELYAMESYRSMVKKVEKDSIVLDRTDFIKEERSIQQRIIRNSIAYINHNLQGVTEQHISNILKLFIEGGTGKSIDIIDNIIAKTSYGNLIIEKKKDIGIGDYLYEIPINGSTYVEELGFTVSTETITVENSNIYTSNRFIKYLDYDKIKDGLYIRNRRAGDRFVPFGMKGNKKLKDYFIDEKIPREERDLIPILVDEKNILWIVGYRISELYKVTDLTKTILKISFEETIKGE